jgi:hypothetical protein
MFAFEYNLSTTIEENTKGSWTGWHVELGEQVKDKALFLEAKVSYDGTKNLGKLLGASTAAKETDSLPY